MARWWHVLRTNPGTSMLVLVNLVLLGMVAWIALWSPPTELVGPPSQRTGSATPRDAMAGLVKPDPVVVATELAVRPLFHDTRRPVRPPAPVPQAAPVARPEPLPADRYRLVGVLIGRERQMWAYVIEKGGDETAKIAVGDTLDGWLLSRIDDERVILTKEDKQSVLEFADGGTGNSYGDMDQHEQRRRARAARSR